MSAKISHGSLRSGSTMLVVAAAAALSLPACPGGSPSGDAGDSGLDSGVNCSARRRLWRVAWGADGGVAGVSDGTMSLRSWARNLPSFAWPEPYVTPFPPYGLLVLQDGELVGDFEVSVLLGGLDGGVDPYSDEVSKGALVVFSTDPAVGFAWTGFERSAPGSCSGLCVTSYIARQSPEGVDAGYPVIGYNGGLGTVVPGSEWSVAIIKSSGSLNVAMHFNDSIHGSGTVTQTYVDVPDGRYRVGLLVGNGLLDGGAAPAAGRTAVFSVKQFTVDGGGGAVESDDFLCDTLWQ